ncbi:anti-sigma factor family protein [Rhizobium metallidurans]|uniref:Anti-sigma factor RsiW n=1 Tax=Rhizobium metallidurans TaxID=1265931 RepID=A0A7W6CQW2_9HYPH|nr:anti-sigma factor [Rhizobium metallidurans]MBB3963337.1 anti-sigma factor RsiW [Rhizobium metallidurans]
MSAADHPVTEADLHAYTDGLLPEPDRPRIEAWLRDNPDDAAKIADWQAQNAGIKAMFSGYDKGRPGDADMIGDRVGGSPALSPWSRRLGAVAAAIVVFAAGTLAGHYGPALFERPPLQLTAQETFPKEARNAFLVYASEVRHPVEVFANEEAHLATWLGKRLAIENLKVPDLKSLNYNLVGGRLLPVDGKPGAMFMYENQAGERLTVLVGRNASNRTTSFRFASSDNVETFYWIDGELGYAVTGEISREELRKVAEECYRQFPS